MWTKSLYWICYNIAYVSCFWFFVLKVCGILALRPQIKPTPPALEGKVLTTGLPGKSHNQHYHIPLTPQGALLAFIFTFYIDLLYWPSVLGRCTLGFPWAQGQLHTNLDVLPANLPSIWARWTRTSVFHWYCHLAAVFSPLVGLENVISHIEDLIKFTQRALSDSSQAIGLLNYEVSMRRAILQSCLALDSLTSSKWASVL